ncbi:MAG: MATE family efflux transporter, partial [Lachnospiraceae bacterium]
MRMRSNKNRAFCSGKFKTLLLTASVSMGMEYLMLLSDTIIIGNIFGEAAIAASNLVTPLFSVAVFISTMISIGTSMLYSYEMGKFQKDRADGLFGQGVILAGISGIALFLLAFFGKNAYFAFMNPSAAVGAYAWEYYRYYQFIMLLYPIYALLIDMVYSDGDELVCNLSYGVQIGINIPASIILCHKIGVGGASLGTLIGTVLSLAVLSLHFFRRQNSLRFSWHLQVQDVVRVAKSGMMDSIVYLLWGMTACVANKFILSRFGEFYLPVLSVIISVIELTVIFDGIGQAITPLVNVYRGEKNTVGIRKMMSLAGKAATLEGIGASLLLFLGGRYLARMLGITDPGLLNLCETAVRFSSPFLVCSALLFLLTTYYLLIEKMLLATWITILKDFLALVTLMILGGIMFGVNGVWIGFGIAPLLSLGISSLLICRHYGRKNFPLLLKQEGEIWDFDLILTEQSILNLRDELEKILLDRNRKKKLVSRIMLLTEELEMLILEKNPGKEVAAECTLLIDGDEIQLVFRDSGVLFDITDEDSAVSSLRSYLVANMMSYQKRKNHLVTTSYNRNAFRFEKSSAEDE